MNPKNERDGQKLRDELAELYTSEASGLGVATSDTFVSSVPTKDRRRGQRRGLPDGTGSMLLIERDGTLSWEYCVWGGARPSGRRAGRATRAGMLSWLRGDDDEKVVTELHFELLEPNKVIAAIQSLDERFASATPAGATSAFGLRRWKEGKLVPVERPSAVKKGQRILLFVHGTFSNCDHMFKDEFLATKQGRDLVANGAFDEVLTFDHPTLSISPMLNAYELATRMRGVEAEVCAVAHSRGGLVTRWWLEGFGGADAGPRRAVLVGCPLAGTSLASPTRIREAMNLLTNVGTALKVAGSAASAFAPFLYAPVVLLRVFNSVTSALNHLPIADAAIALVPGLGGQSRAGNNPELVRLRSAAPGKAVYSVVRSNFEPEDAGWRFWKLFRKDKLVDTAADTIFPGENDLVVDTSSMDDVFAEAAHARPKVIRDWGTNATVHHLNYFRQRQTIDAIAEALPQPV